MAGFDIATFEVSRERLEGLMFFRVVVVTLFLGSAVAIDVEALSALSSFKNAVILGLIVATYALTIVYAVLVRRVRRLDLLALGQLVIDLGLTVALVAVTNGVDSLFLFLFLVTIISSAVVLGRRVALAFATITAIALIAISLYQLQTGDYSSAAITSIAYRVSLNSAGAFVIAVLSGYLAERLSEATAALEEQQVDLAELRALNENILASLSSGLVTIDSHGKIIYVNRAAVELTGMTEQQILGSNVSVLFPDLASANAETRRMESTFQREDGVELQLGFSVSELRDSSREESGKIVIFQDLTDIRALEEEMQRSRRLAAIGELAAGIAHEIRNPLASISGSVEMLRDDTEKNDDNHLLLSIIVREVDRLDELISDFLEYSRPRPLKLAPFRLDDTVREVVELYAQGSPGHTIELDVPDSTPAPVLVDLESFRQVIWNLIKNGTEACEDASRDICVIVTLSATDTDVVLAVEDDGAGLDDKTAEHIFEPFFTTKEKGTGLGLATIYRIIEEHGGVIRHVKPERLRGARFEVRLKMVQEREAV